MKFEINGLDGMLWTGQEPVSEKVIQVAYSKEKYPFEHIAFDKLQTSLDKGYKFATAPEMYAFLKQVSQRMDAQPQYEREARAFMDLIGTPGLEAKDIHTNTVADYAKDGMIELKHNAYFGNRKDLVKTYVNPDIFHQTLDELSSTKENPINIAFIQAILGTEDSLSTINTVLKKISGLDQVLVYSLHGDSFQHPVRQVSFSANTDGFTFGTFGWPSIKGYIPMVRT